MTGTSGDLAGRAAIVTGAASGIGLATARALLAAGATVHAVDLQESPALLELGDDGAHVLRCNVTDRAQRRQLVEQTARSDFLVNSAGINRLPAVGDATEDDWDVVFDVNAKAVFFLCQSAGAQLRDGGAIVNLSSIAARNAVNTETGIYAATKAAVLSMTRTFAHAYAHRNIRVNAVVPGLIDTPMQDYVLDQIAAVRSTDRAELASRRAATVPLGRLGTPEECAATILWLLSGASGYLTGQAIAVDGGATMV